MENKLDKNSVWVKFACTASGGKEYQVDYNLDVIISVGYRMKSLLGIRFRIWATGILKEFMKKGFALDDDRLKRLGDVNNVLEMYRVLHPEDTEVVAEDIDIVTLGNVLVDGIYNDLGFRVGNRLMVLVEAQSTWSENIIVRALMYLVQTYQDYINENKLDVYSSARIELPEPELYVIYTGNKKDRPDVLKFSDKFFGGKKTAVEVSVKVLCDESRENVVGQYIAFCRIYDEARKEYDGGRETIEKVIEICRNENVLKEIPGEEREGGHKHYADFI